MKTLQAVLIILALIGLTGYMDMVDVQAEREYLMDLDREKQKDVDAVREYALCVKRKICQ